jgi:O-methyltransferase
MNVRRLRALARRHTPYSVRVLSRMARDPSRILHNPKDIASVVGFLRREFPGVSRAQALSLVLSMYRISYSVDCPHTEHEMLSFITTILTTPQSVRGCVVEAGCFQGGSTAKFSLAARLAGRRLVVFDSFEGLPENQEAHARTIFGEIPNFQKGVYRGTLEEVQRNVGQYGELGVCTFVKGWFDDTMPAFSEPIAAVYLDVDLVASTRTCLKYLYPLLSPGGHLFSQDGHLPLVIETLRDPDFWMNEVGYAPPHFEGLGSRKLVMARKPLLA